MSRERESGRNENIYFYFTFVLYGTGEPGQCFRDISFQMKKKIQGNPIFMGLFFIQNIHNRFGSLIRIRILYINSFGSGSGSCHMYELVNTVLSSCLQKIRKKLSPCLIRPFYASKNIILHSCFWV